MSIGKRKRDNQFDNDSEDGTEDEQALRARFQKAFEARFKPLPPSERPVQSHEQPNSDEDEEDEDGDKDGDEDSAEPEWDGLSDEEAAVQIVDHKPSRGDDLMTEKQERKSFMSSKPPTSSKPSTTPTKSQPTDPEEDPAEKANLKNDLALQRLLKESHLLNPSTFSSATSAPDGKSRLKSLDLRIQDLGARKSLSEQEKMPLSHRRGIAAKAAEREGRRRREAVENGVVLERAKSKAPGKGAKRRVRGVGGPGVGKFRGGTLKLSERDVRSIQGGKDRGGGKKKKGRR